MTAPLKPALVTAYGKESWGFIPAATVTGPTLSQMNSASGLNLSCYVFGDQEGLSSETEKVELPRRLCETITFEGNGSTKYSMADLVVSYSPQAAAASDGVKPFETLINGLAGYLWRRSGIAGTTDVAVGQFVDLVPIEFGPATPGKTSNDSNGVFTSVHPVAVTGAPTFRVAIVT